MVAAITALVIVGWAVAVLTVDRAQFVLIAPKGKTGFEVTLSLVSLFVALVLALLPDEPVRERLRWVATGFLLLGLGGLAFGYFLPLVDGTTDLDTLLYGSLLTRTLGGAAMAVGLWPAMPPRCDRRAVFATVAAFALLATVVVLAADRLPVLARIDSLEAPAATNRTIPQALTGWHWSLSLVALLASLAAAVGAIRHVPGRSPGAWLVAAMVLMSGAQLHAAFWPAAFSAVFTSSSLLRLSFTVVIAVGVVLDLQRVAAEREGLLAAERATNARLLDLARLRADFANMVAHELGTPLAAVRHAAELAATEPTSPLQERALAIVASEVGLLDTLVADMQATATAERDDFAVHPFPVDLALLLADAVAYASTLPGDHKVICPLNVRVKVLADPERIAQVLHNLLRNADKFSPEGTPITIRTVRVDDRVWIAVSDRGPGIGPDDMSVIFEKFGRGREARKRDARGRGLGLYVSRRIVDAHGGRMWVDSTPGEGAAFWFELRIAP
jgi:signal transduction histidine kinase